jgi:hypothetical protein
MKIIFRIIKPIFYIEKMTSKIKYWRFLTLHGWQGSQGLVLGWILRNRKLWWQRRQAGEVATTMASLPDKNLPWLHCAYSSTFGWLCNTVL